MTTRSQAVDPGSWFTADHSQGTQAVKTETNGAYVAPRDYALGACLVISWSAVLAASESVTITANAQDATSAAGAGVADFTNPIADGNGLYTLAAFVAHTDGGAGATATGVTFLRLPDIAAHRGFLRSQVLLTNGGAGAVEYSTQWIWGGGETLPSSGSFLTGEA